jgi:hypothetical protein
MLQRFVDPAAVVAEIARVRALSGHALRRRWQAIKSIARAIGDGHSTIVIELDRSQDRCRDAKWSPPARQCAAHRAALWRERRPPCGHVARQAQIR